ncbi:MAG: sulfate adenylyltransferase subunit CysN [Acidobacteria bacterium]|nr:sulfate adenylyltransferase subunit CysN [Acidobacteriota bacterium]
MATAGTASLTGVELFLEQNEEKDLLRLSTAGSVDDGKSTLIGRLLYDSKGVYEDQLASIARVSTSETAGVLDFALLTDGLRAEREQGITIDVAYRYFSTPRRKFIIADTPGHEQYTRNMATGASTANLAIILIDARNGVLPQSRRHAYIAALLGIPHIVVAVNKMDLAGFREEVFRAISDEFAGFARQLEIRDLHFIPISALEGDNVVGKSRRMAWFEGPALLEYLESVHIARDRNLTDLRFPVQMVLRPNPDFRGFAGQVASGVVRPGDPVIALPSGRTSRVKSIATWDGELEAAFPPMSVTLCLEDEIDLSRGEMLAPPLYAPQVSRHLEAHIVWMTSRALEPNRQYLVKHTTQVVRGRVAAIRHKVNVNTLEEMPAARLELNEIGVVRLETNRPLFFDPYRRNRITGSFILIDPLTNETAGAGMILRRAAEEGRRPAAAEESPEFERSARVTAGERQARAGHAPATVWLAGSPEIAYAAERNLFDRGCLVHVIAGITDSAAAAELARVLNTAGLIALCALAKSSPEETRRARALAGEECFVEIDAARLRPSPEQAAVQICAILEEKGFIRALEDPFTGGSGI